MNAVKLYQHQQKALEDTADMTHVAYYHDMGLGKTYTGGEKLIQLGAKINLVICQKSKIGDWINHFKTNYDVDIFDLTNKNEMNEFITFVAFARVPKIGVINYDLAFRRSELIKLHDYTLLLDESSLIQNDTAKRSKFILKLKPKNVILLSGTPTGGKYENLWSQLHLLGWNITKKTYWAQYVDVEYRENEEGFPIKIVTGYKNVPRLKRKMRECGCEFLKTDEVFDLPEQNFIKLEVPTTTEYEKFRSSGLIKIGDVELVGDTILKQLLYERMLCGQYNQSKIDALKDLMLSTDDRLIVFYNWQDELRAIKDICIALDKPLSIVNGQCKDLSCYEQYDNSITAIQYQAGSMGLNLQKARRIAYFTLPLSSELFEQSKKRIHRIGQESTCFYYIFMCKNSVEERIYATLEMRKDYTDDLFQEGV